MLDHMFCKKSTKNDLQYLPDKLDLWVFFGCLSVCLFVCFVVTELCKYFIMTTVFFVSHSYKDPLFLGAGGGWSDTGSYRAE